MFINSYCFPIFINPDNNLYIQVLLNRVKNWIYWEFVLYSILSFVIDIIKKWKASYDNKFKKSATVEQIQASKNWLIKKEISFQEIDSDNYTLLLLIGDTSHISIDTVQALEGVAEVRVIQEQYKLASRTFNQYDTIITLDNGVKIGGENFRLWQVLAQ